MMTRPYTRKILVGTDKKAVSVHKDKDGTESVRYKPDNMVEGVVYQVTWNGVPYGVRKNKKSVSFMRFVPD